MPQHSSCGTSTPSWFSLSPTSLVPSRHDVPEDNRTCGHGKSLQDIGTCRTVNFTHAIYELDVSRKKQAPNNAESAQQGTQGSAPNQINRLTQSTLDQPLKTENSPEAITHQCERRSRLLMN